MKLQVICRGSTHDGLGHLFRVRTFARVAQESHQVEVIAITEPGLESIFERLTCPVRFVQKDQEALSLLFETSPDVRLFDLTRLDRSVLEKVMSSPGRAPLTASLSPVFEYMPRMDVMFTRSIHAASIPGVKTYGGLQYSIFGDNCLVIGDLAYQQTLAQPNLPIAVCMGGTDAANKTLSVLRALTRVQQPGTIWALLGEGYAHSYNALVECARGNSMHEIILAKTNRSLWRIMSSCAVAIVAGGLTTVEAIYAGLPTINLFERPEHVEAMASELFELGVCINGGLFSDDSLQTMIQALQEFHADRDKLWQMHRRCHGLVDARGSERVLRVLADELRTRKGR